MAFCTSGGAEYDAFVQMVEDNITSQQTADPSGLAEFTNISNICGLNYIKKWAL